MVPERLKTVGTRIVVSGLCLPRGTRWSGGHVLADHATAEQGRQHRPVVQVAHNRKVDGVTHAEVLLNLGREDALDRDGLSRLVASINRYLGEPASAGLPADAAHLVGQQLRVTESRPMGTVHLLDGTCLMSPRTSCLRPWPRWCPGISRSSAG